MGFTIEMTLRGVLLAGKWKTEEEVNSLTTDGKRNTLIAELCKLTKETEPQYQCRGDDYLIGAAAVVVFLLEAGIRKRDEIKTYSDDDARSALIVANNAHTEIPIGTLQNYGSAELVQTGLAWYAKSKTIAEILELEWKIDFGKVIEAAPDVIATEHYDNRESSEPLVSTFTFEKEVENKSSFSQEHGFDLHIGVETKFNAGIPCIASNETTVKIDATSTNKWSFGGENTTRQKYSHCTQVNVPPGKHIQSIGQVTSGKLNVPYRAKIRTDSGSVTYIEGTWNGVSTTNLVVSQKDILH